MLFNVSERELLYIAGHVQDSNVSFLLDSGASSNFISSALVQALDLPVHEVSTTQRVKLPNGSTLETSTYILVPITLGGVQLPRTKFFLLDMQQGVVLGLSFLKQRSVIVDFASSKVSFKYKNEYHEVLGETVAVATDSSDNCDKLCTLYMKYPNLPRAFKISEKRMRKQLQKPCQVFLMKKLDDDQPVENVDVSSDGGTHSVGTLSVQGNLAVYAKSLYNTHKANIDQFVDNVISTNKSVQIKTQVTPIKNILFVNSNSGREPFARMYQRTSFHLGAHDVSMQPVRAQVLACNRFQVEHLPTLQKILTTPSTLFVDNIFIVQNQSQVAQVQTLINSSAQVYNSRIQIAGVQSTIQDNYISMLQHILHAGSPMLYLLDRIYNKDNKLPNGAVEHILSAPPDMQNDVSDVLKEYRDVFPDELPAMLPPNRGIDDVHYITVQPNTKPLAKAAYKTGPNESAIIQKEVQSLLEAGLIKPSKSAWAAPVLLVKKPDGSIRFCTDYRNLNSVTIKDKFPIPRTQELVDRLAGAKFFSSLDLRSGYWQIRLNPADADKSAFITRHGLFQWEVLTFGYTNAPSTFQRVMNNVFKPLLDKCIVVYLDDILIYSRSLKEHKQHLRAALALLRKYYFYAKLKKCHFFQTRVTFLGHDIDSTGMHLNASKAAVISAWPRPQTLKAVQKFIGFCQYFRQYIKSFSELALPLTALSKKDKGFAWDAECEQAFQTLKNKLCTAPVLKLYESDKPLELHTDASLVALGAVLYQHNAEGKLQPIAFHSRTLNQAERNYSATERELLAIVDSCRHWRHYLYGSQCTVRTDHRPLQYFFTQPNLSPRQLRWAEYLCEFQPTMRILYLSGRNNVPPDVLTREIDLGLAQFQTQMTLNVAQVHQVNPEFTTQQIRVLQEQDKSLLRVHEQAKSTDSRFHYREGVLHTSNNQLVIPNSLIDTVIAEHHDCIGHQGIRRTIARITQRYWFPRLEHKVRYYVKECDVCQRIKHRSGKPVGKLVPLPVPQRPWQHISMDFVTDLPPNQEGGTSVLVVVDRFSKQAHLIQLSSDTTSYTLAQYYLSHIVRLHGVPESITSDRDPRFIARFWQELMRILGTSCNLSTAYHPQTDGQTERTIQTVEGLLRSFTFSKPQDYAQYLPQVELALNCFPSTTTGMSPHKIVYGTDIKLPVDIAMQSNVQEATQVVEQLQNTWKLVQQQLHRQANNMKQYYDRHRNQLALHVNDWVMLSTVNVKLPAHKTHKLKPRWIGPFKIAKCIGQVAYKLELPSSMRIHPVFHVSVLKKYEGVAPLQPDPVSVDSEQEYEIERLVSHRYKPNGKLQYLVRWKGYDAASDEWLEDKNLENAQAVLKEYKRVQKL